MRKLTAALPPLSLTRAALADSSAFVVQPPAASRPAQVTSGQVGSHRLSRRSGSSSVWGVLLFGALVTAALLTIYRGIRRPARLRQRTPTRER